MPSEAEFNRQIRQWQRREAKHQKQSLTGPMGQPIVIREKGKTITCRGWLRAAKSVADDCLVEQLQAVVSRLRSTLPIKTGRLRRSTRQIVYARDKRSFRVWSYAPYSRFVRTAPPVWRRWANWLTMRLRACRGTVPLKCTVKASGSPVKTKTVKYRMRVARLQPRARTFSQASLVNEIHGTYRPVKTLRPDIVSAIKKELL